jgi:TonB-linked SusC/RagA family outer membrane protein
MKIIKWSVLLFLFPIIVFSQEKIITGQVIDDSGMPLTGVTILLKLTNKGAITDLDGQYVLSTGEIVKGILEFSYLGYATKEIPFNSETNKVNATLSESQEELEEVVVTALGIKRDKKSLSYSTQGVNTEDMTEARSSNFLNALSGKAAGVQITNSSTPTGSTRVIIRGLTSITGNNQPLYILDGVPLDSSSGDAGVSVWNEGDDIDLGSPISGINPDDIDSIQILKGANASALYGSRASNGVVIITTKKAKKGTSKINVNVNSNMSVVSNREYPNYQYSYGAGNGGRLVQNAGRLDATTGLPTVGSYNRAYGAPFLGQQVLDYNGTVGTYAPDINNVKDLYQTGVVNTNTFAISRATDKNTLRFSYGKTIGDHVIKRMEEINRDNIALRMSQDITDKLRANVSFIYTHQKVNNRMYQNGSNRNPANNYMYMLPNMSQSNLLPYKDENNEAFQYEGDFNNPYWNIFENSNQDITNRVVTNITLNWEILKGLELKTRVNGALNDVDRQEFNNKGASYDPNGLYREVTTSRQNWNYEAILNYTKKFNDFSLVSLIGANRFDVRTDGNRLTAISLFERDIKSLSNGDEFVPEIFINNNKRINSVYGSVSLGYQKTYFLDVTSRNDWSSTLPAANNSYFYPSVGGTILFSEFIPRNKILTFGKIRASYARVGNDTGFNQIRNSYVQGGNYNNTDWVALERIRKNLELKPELTSSTEFGIEAKFFNNRISFDGTYYKSSTNNQIINVSTTPTSGFVGKFLNAGEIQNEGMELFLSAKLFDKKFKWSTDINWSKNESFVASLFDGVESRLIRSWFNVGVFAEVGEPFGNIRGNSQLVDPETGTPLVLANGRAAWESNQLLGNAQPDWIGSIRNSFSYKGFSLNFLVDVKMGGDLYSGTMAKTYNHGVHAGTLEGREEWLLSTLILGENNNERQGRGLFGNNYADSDRPKGRIYENSALGVQDEDGNWSAERDANGEIIYTQRWLNPQVYGYDGLQDQRRFVYDASYVKLREVTLGYNIPHRLIKKIKIKNAKISVVGRNLWTIYRNTPQGIDPESGTTSGNGQGIEYGSFLPTRTLGVNVKLVF